ncbi:MAG: hypothetical protein IT426_00100 [Pirellulales bacterium]|nr:hypothetical protein [Pirellulales bacterium]
MRSSFSRCAGVVFLAMVVSGCAGGKWPWQSSSPFSSSNTPSSTNIAGATKPSTLAGNAPPSSVTAPPANYPSYQGSAAGMHASNNLAPAYQPTNPPTGSTATAYTASSNNTASRAGTYVAPQQGAYPVNNSIPSSAPAADYYGTNPAQPSYNATPPSGSYNGTSTGYGAAPGGGYGATPSADYGGSGAAQPASPYGGVPAESQPNYSSYPQTTANANSLPAISPIPPASAAAGNNNAAGWNGAAGNPVRTATQSVNGNRYAAAGDRYGGKVGDPAGNSGGTASPVVDPRYGILPVSTPDPRSVPPADTRSGDGGSYPSTYPNSSSPANNGGTDAADSYGVYQPGSVSSYEPANRPAVFTAGNPADETVR